MMMKAKTIFGFVALCSLFAAAGQLRSQGFFADPFRLDNPALFRQPGIPSVFNNGLVSSNIAFDWTVPTTPLPRPVTTAGQTLTAPTSAPRNFPDRLSDWAPKLGYVTGEVGFLYAHGSGKWGGDLKETYIIGEVGDDKFHINVGAAYQDSNFRLPRQIR